jgi:hypothetical protein
MLRGEGECGLLPLLVLLELGEFIKEFVDILS